MKTSGEIVIRLEAGTGPVPELLREASYRAYKAQTWYAGASKGDFEGIREETNGSGSWILVGARTNTSSVKIASYLPGGKALLPLPSTSGRLDHLPAYLLQKNSAGTVLAQGPGLVIFDASFGPGQMMDSPPTRDDTNVPPKEAFALETVAANLHLSAQSRERALSTISAFFRGNFTYSLWQGYQRLAKTNETPLSRFLLQTRSGHCEYFATATVLLLRQAGFSARYAIGYAVHERAGSRYLVRARDGHAWCLVWNKQKEVWEDFDTTPASWVEAETKRASPLEFLSDAWSRMIFEFSKFRWGQSRLRLFFLWVLVPVLALLLYQILSRSRRRSRGSGKNRSGSSVSWPGLDSEFYQLEQKLVERGFARRPGEPLSEWLLRPLADPALDAVKAPLQRLLQLHYRYRFDPEGINHSERQELRNEAQSCLTAMGQC
jgi:transglutaminase-like putative cysteine protease